MPTDHKFEIQEIQRNSSGNKSVPSEKAEDEEQNYEVENNRWIIITFVAALIFLNTASWISFAPIANYVNGFYGEGASSWFSLIFLLITIPMGFAGMMYSKTFGLTAAIRLASLFQILGSFLRLLSKIAFGNLNSQFDLCLLGQAVTALAYPLIMFLPSKVSVDWFPEHQRTIATTIGVMSAPLGVMLTNIIAPILVQSSNEVWILNFAIFIPSVIIGVLASTLIQKDTPSKPSGRSAKTTNYTYWKSFSVCFKNPTYVSLVIVIGGGVGMFNCLYTMIQEMMCPTGYDNQIAGACACVMIVSGVLGAFISGFLVDKFKCYRLMLLASLVVAVVAGLSFLQLTRLEGVSKWVFYLVCVIFGFFGLATYPVGLELASECTFPAAPEVVSGTIILFGQAFSALFVIIFKHFSITLTDYEDGPQKCLLSKEDSINTPKDFYVSIYTLSTVAAMLVVIIFFSFACFTLQFKRREPMSK